MIFTGTNLIVYYCHQKNRNNKQPKKFHDDLTFFQNYFCFFAEVLPNGLKILTQNDIQSGRSKDFFRSLMNNLNMLKKFLTHILLDDQKKACFLVQNHEIFQKNAVSGHTMLVDFVINF